MRNDSRQIAGFSIVEALIAVAIMGVIAAAFGTLMNSLALENRNMSDKSEAVDIERQLGMVMADDDLCACQLAGSPAMKPEASPEDGAATKAVELTKITTNCADRTKVFAQVGQKLTAVSSSFMVSRIAVRDLRATGHTDPGTGVLDEYQGAIYVEFDPKFNSSRALRPIKVTKVFNTDPTGTLISTCSSSTDFFQSSAVSNAAGASPLKSASASCPLGYSVVSGGWASVDPQPNGCGTGGGAKMPLVIENRPFTGPRGTAGWLVTATCMNARAYAVCQRGHSNLMRPTASP